MRPLTPRYTASPPTHSSPLNVFRTLSGIELPRLLDQSLHGAAEAQNRDHEKQEPDDAEGRPHPRGRREDVPDRRGAASGQLIAIDDPLGRGLAPDLGGHGARDDRQRDRRGERAGGQGDRAVESRDLLEPADDAKHELRPQPEREQADDALGAIAQASSTVARPFSQRACAHPLRRRKQAVDDVDAQRKDREPTTTGWAPPIERTAPIAPRPAPT